MADVIPRARLPHLSPRGKQQRTITTSTDLTQDMEVTELLVAMVGDVTAGRSLGRLLGGL